MTSSSFVATVALFLAGAEGHGVLYEPPARQSGGLKILLPGCAGGSCLWFNQGCSIGCPKATGKGTVYPDVPDCKNPAKPTLNEKKLRTWNLNNLLGDYTKHHPWRKPGSAPVENACGIAGGWYTKGQIGNGGEAPPGFPQGTLGTDVAKSLTKTVWIAGSTAEVAWGITANHGGGYQYRLCPSGSRPTEACFQKIPLDFVGNVQWLQFGHGMDVHNRTEIPAVRVSQGTIPAGSTWTRNPIPACNTPISGGALHSPCTGPMFPPPIKDAKGSPSYGFGMGGCESGVPGLGCSPEQFKGRNFDFGIVDKVHVPNVPDGDYVLSFRWESEQTPQVWNSCGDVTIKSSGTPSKPFVYGNGCEICCPELKAPCSNCTSCLHDKTGDCAYCWNKLKGYAPAIPTITCLGHEDPSGGAPDWLVGDKSKGISWSPGCPKCWADKDACKPKMHLFAGTEDFVV